MLSRMNSVSSATKSAGASRARASSRSAEVATGGVVDMCVRVQSGRNYARSHSRDLRHVHGRHRGAGARGRPSRHRLGPERVSADVRPARRARHRADRGLRPATAAAASGHRRRRQRDEPRQRARRSAAGERHSLHVRAGVAGAARARGPLDARRRRHARQDHDLEHPRVDPGVRRPRSGIPDRRRARQLQRDRAARRRPALRRRGGRVRHGVLRQARQVRSLPSAHRGAQQPRARPRRYLSRRRRDPVAVPSAAAHGASQRPRSSPTPATRT